MQLTPWRKPFRLDITRFNREMDSLRNRFFGEFQPFAESGEDWLPSMDVTESDAEINVRAELPGTVYWKSGFPNLRESSQKKLKYKTKLRYFFLPWKSLP
jgi:hypothetical protein